MTVFRLARSPQIEMKKELILYPRYFGPNIQDLLVEKLIQTVEGSCSGRYGFVVGVTDVIEVGKGKIREGGPPCPSPLAGLAAGLALSPPPAHSRVHQLHLRPACACTAVPRWLARARGGGAGGGDPLSSPLRCLPTHRRCIPPTLPPGGGLATFPMRYNAIVFRPFKGEVFDAVVTTVNKLGFFAQVGPLQVFVSKHLIPTDMQFDPQSTPASYVSSISEQQPQRISKDSEVRLRVIATRVDASEIFAIGTIKDEYLGLLD